MLSEKKHILLGSSLIGYYSDFRQYISTDIRILLYFQSIFNFLVKNKYSIQGPWKIHALRSINVISNGKQCVLSENRTNPLVRISIMCLARNIQIFYGAPLVRHSILANLLRVCLVWWNVDCFIQPSCQSILSIDKSKRLPATRLFLFTTLRNLLCVQQGK